MKKKIILYLVIVLAVGCSTFATVFEPKLQPYAGVQHATKQFEKSDNIGKIPAGIDVAASAVGDTAVIGIAGSLMCATGVVVLVATPFVWAFEEVANYR